MATHNPPPLDDPTPTPGGEGYTVLARRYRPQDFSEIVGQEPIARALTNALISNRVAHAYLFTGARGVGKTSTARILAKALNCVKGPTPTPCGVCEFCKSIAVGEDVDVLEFDAASNRGIDEIRNIRSNVQYRPSRARFKIYIIDEVHMLTPQAFNALLKTLEEPPAHVKFIFATTEVQEIPVTILSRCQRFDLAGITPSLIKQRLHQIVGQEKREADDDALELIARRAGGSMRDAQSLLDQLLAFSSERLTAEAVHHLLGTASAEHLVTLVEAILARDPGRTLNQLEAALTQGFQLGELLDQLIAYWRDLMVVHCAGDESKDLSIQGKYRQTLVQQARALALDTILASLDILSAARGRLRDSAHARTVVEMALVRLSRLADLVSVAQVAQWLGQIRSESPAAAGAPGSRPAAMPESEVKKNALNPLPEPAKNAVPLALTAETLPAVWSQVLRQVGNLLASDLDKAETPAIFGPNTLVIRFPSGYNKERDHCQAPSSVARIEATLKKILGRGYSLRIESPPAVPGKAAPAVVPSVEAAPAAARPPRRHPRDEAEKEPLVKRALEVLDAQVMRADEGFGTAEAPPASSALNLRMASSEMDADLDTDSDALMEEET